MKRQQNMSRQAQAYLKHRRALGFELRTSGKLLVQFAKYADRTGRRGPLTTDLILKWVHLPESAARSYKANRLSIVRGFARYLAARDGQTEVPDWRLMPKVFYRRPYLFTERQLEQLLAAAGRMKPSYPLRPRTYRTLFGLLASTGLRICEALKLTRGHVDLEHGILRIERTKFKKSRLAPLHPTVTRALRRYAAARDRQWGQDDDKPFFVGCCGSALPYRTVLNAFRNLCIDLGWQRSNGGRPRPRIHDLRHSFACRRLLRWRRNHENVNQRMAALSTYLGHGRVTDTYWYLTGTPELLALAGGRFERFARKAEGGRS
jgi:integrase